MSTVDGVRAIDVKDVLKAVLYRTHYYRIMNYVYQRAFGSYHMLHFPYFEKEGENLLEAQENLTEACLRELPPLKGKRVLEVGCGNGVQSIYIKERHNPEFMMGLDLEADNVAVANHQCEQKHLKGLRFIQSDAQDMVGVESDSFDYIVNIESGLHYPEKHRFFGEIYRVLKPGGSYVIADIIAKKEKRNFILSRWEKGLYQNYRTLDIYLDGLKNAGLTVDLERDITPPIMEGFNRSSSWYEVLSRKGQRFTMAALTLFAKLQVARHKYYLRNHVTYYMLSGSKPE